jgi:hypothetical protein
MPGVGEQGAELPAYELEEVVIGRVDGAVGVDPKHKDSERFHLPAEQKGDERRRRWYCLAEGAGFNMCRVGDLVEMVDHLPKSGASGPSNRELRVLSDAAGKAPSPAVAP